jgi:Cyclin, N-terminal domain/Cyclin, C-terminal domain
MAPPCHSACKSGGKRFADDALRDTPSPASLRCGCRIQTLLRDEAVFRSRSDQIAFENSTQLPQLSLWRDRVAQWYYNVVDHMNAPREVVFLAVNFLDRISAHDSVNKPISKEEYEITSTTCIFLALRVFSGRTDLRVSDLLQVCESRLQVTDIQDTGARLLRNLSLKTPVINPSTFAKAYLQLLQPVVSAEVALSLLEVAMYLIELSVCDHYLAKVPASELAFAAVVASIKSAIAGTQIDGKFQDQFLKALEDETSLPLYSAEIQRCYARLLANYNQSDEGITIVGPVLIQDDPETPTPCHADDSTQSLVALLPWSPTNGDLAAFEMKRPSKRSKLC